MTQDAHKKPAGAPAERVTFRRPIHAPSRQPPGLSLALTGAVVVILVAVGAITVAVVDRRWAAVPVILGALGLAMFLYRWSMKATVEHAKRDFERQLREREIYTTRLPLEIRLAFDKVLPAVLTAIVCAAFGAAFLLAGHALVVFIAIFA